MNEAEIIRYAALLRGTESAWQAVSYGLTSIAIMGEVGGIYINFGLWAVSILPAWLVVRNIGKDDQGVTEIIDPGIPIEMGRASSDNTPETKA